MKNIVIFLFSAIIAIALNACRKTSFITSSDAQLEVSADTLRYDTVFTTTGSVTQAFKIFNTNSQKLRLNKVKLMGGAISPFKMNVDGTSGTDLNDIEIEANDSIYVFLSVTINPTAANLPFVVRDSVLINYNGNNRLVQLEAFGQNALFLRNRRLTVNDTLKNNLPVVILGSLTVDPNVTLVINKGTKIYCHADAPLLINGTLKVNGEKFDSMRVIFRGDRLDEYYRDFPGSWPGIYFGNTSKDNVLNFAVIKNAYQGIVTQFPALNGLTKITLNECIIDNIYDAGILSLNSTINATNCLISNCGYNIGIGSGGTYNFTYCTAVSYANNYIFHKQPVLLISNGNGTSQVNDLNAVFRNCIFYGEGGIVDDEIKVEKLAGGTQFSLKFENVLYVSSKTDPAATYSFTNCIKNQSPQFDSINVGRRYYDFRLNPGVSSGIKSPAIDKGVVTVPSISFDLSGNPRVVGGRPDMGCYETQ